MEFSDKVSNLSRYFEGKIQIWQYDAVRDYINHNEPGIALEILIEYIIEENQEITKYMFDEIKDLLGIMNSCVKENSMKSLKNLMK